jgi:aldehyde dehydrogenase
MELTIEKTRRYAERFRKPDVYGHFIGGEWVGADSGETIALTNPATLETVAYIQSGNAIDAKRAVDAAYAAFPKWSRMYPNERQAIIAAIAARLRERVFDYAMMEALNNGKPITQAINDVSRAANHLDTYAGAPYEMKGETFDLPDAIVLTHREPVGVVAQIIPWNVPMSMFTMKIGPALASGCTIVMKPSEVVCLAVMEFVRDIADLLPPGVLNVVTGYGQALGEPILTDPRVRKVAFTGSRATARKILEMAGHNIIPQTMELGGKSAHIVCEDADLEKAATSAVTANTYNKGEMCIAGSRLFVHRKIYSDFMELLRAKLAAVPQGDPLDPATIMGPQASQAQFDKILYYLDLGQKEGATFLAGGQRARIPGLENGLFIQPTLLGNVRNEMRVMQEEIFGPVTGVVQWDDEDEMIRQVNDTEFGLAGGIWTQNLDRAHKLSRRMETGMIWINRYLNLKPNQWMGGVKASGFGREAVRSTIDHYTYMKSLVINLD